MCLAPNRLIDGTLVGCRDCWQCRGRKIMDWSGRCIAESMTSRGSNAVTLTYGRELDALGEPTGEKDHVRAAVLTYSDVQKYLKRLRKAGYKFRYLVTGEYGSLKGRAHWHIIFYWENRVPKHERRNPTYMDRYWPHGFSYWKEVTPVTVAYNCKYVQKDLDDAEAQGHLAMSKKPPLGARYFAQRAQRFVEQGLAPQDLFYSFPGVNDERGKPLQFLLSGRSAELFLEQYVVRFYGLDRRGLKFQGPPQQRYGRWHPSSELVDEFMDAECAGWKADLDEVAIEIRNKQYERKIRQWQKEVAETERGLAALEQPSGQLAGYIALMQPGFDP